MACLLTNQDALLKYLTTLIPKRYAVPIQKEILHFVTHKGVEYTVGRLKDIKQQLVSFHANEGKVLVSSHADGTPKGSFRTLFRLDRLTALRVMSVYTGSVSGYFTKNQVRKFLESVNPTSDYKIIDVSIDDSVYGKAKKIALYGSRRPDFNRWIQKDRLAPSWLDDDRDMLTKVKEDESRIDDHLPPLRCTDHNKRISMRYADLFSYFLDIQKTDFIPWVSGNTPSRYWNNPRLAVVEPPIGGTIGFIQEKGLKLRSVANPFRVYQHCLSELGDWALNLLKGLPWDCTHDQVKGQEYVKAALSKGKTVFCYDLSDATNLFPLEQQVETTRKLVANFEKLDTSLSLFADLARTDWVLPKHFADIAGQDRVKFTRGQPMGLYPSFALFALNHGLLVRHLERLFGKNDTFRIIGDDIVISDAIVAEAYVKAMTDLGCKINLSKSVVSSTLAEFAGKLIDRTGILPVYKWCDFTMDDPLGPIRCLGHKGIRFVPSDLRRSVAYLASLPEPYSLGVNPSGLTLESRVVPNEQKFVSDMKPKPIRNQKLRNRHVIDMEVALESMRYTFGKVDTLFTGVYVAWKTRLLNAVPTRDYIDREYQLEADHYNSWVEAFDPLSPTSWVDKPSRSMINVENPPLFGKKGVKGELNTFKRRVDDLLSLYPDDHAKLMRNIRVMRKHHP